ncbi:MULTISPECIES: hypothetical protein [Staphylococcus]|uniref:CapI protein n=1 Tax=Staphylococcus haemolyticus (strain JCSC1435) TaxID=279808 RepID=Q4L9H0_STAHJ|nr:MULTISPECIES: hypothetical protein [Staphylococcus]AYX84277.1 hypothetical protein EGX85_08195 [Staphylococcus haemolyticus]MBW3857465.1 hypothetical protein [Staphylococcus haemolyticus]MBW5902811.1 hypothetical protein [Staphylococcus haemolyticus]MCH4417168.1 hypothetical protein [Staphylococcus haemolyticus]MCH4504052.1 hypothetical protein [Staphylococcus haemolyticus]
MKNIYRFNVYLASIFTILTLISNFLLYRVSNSYLDDNEAYGLWLIILSVVTWFYIMDFGISNSLRNYLTEALEKRNMLFANKIVSTTYIIMLIPLIFLIILGLVSNYLVNWNIIFNVSENQEETEKLFKIAFFLFPFIFYLNTITYIYHAYFKSYIVNIMQFLNLFVNCIIIKIFDFFEIGNLVTLGLIYFLTNISIYLFFTILFLLKEKGTIKIKLSYFDPKLINSLLGLGLGFFFLDIASLALLNSGPFLISYFFNPSFSVKFQLPYKLLSIFLTLSTIILSPLWTLIIKKMVTKSYSDILAINKKIITLMVSVFSVIFVSTFFLNFAIYIWVGKYYDIEWTFLLLVSTIVMLSIITHVYKTLLNAMSIVYIQVVVYMCGTIVCFLLMFIFLKFLNLSVYYFLMSINIGLLIPALLLPVIFYTRLYKLKKEADYH